MRTKDQRNRETFAGPVDPAVAEAIRIDLGRWYQRNQRDLPWRRTSDPYRVWLSEVMLQQTQVKTMLPYYHRFLQTFPDVHRLARANLQDVLKLWEGLGYYSRARNLHRAAIMVSGNMHGCFPDSKQGWLELPGVGDYIASAVSSIVGGHRHAVVDGNVKRVLARLFCVGWFINQASSYRRFQDLANQLLDTSNPGDHNQAVMELGALVCLPRQPKCPECPVARSCCALKRDCISSFPQKLKRPERPERHLAVGIIFKNNRLLLVQRPNDGFLGGLWELPGGAIAKGADPSEACVKGILRAVNLSVSIVRPVAVIRHTYTHFKLFMQVFECQWCSGRVYRRGSQAHQWIGPSKIDELPLHGAMHKALAAFSNHQRPD